MWPGFVQARESDRGRCVAWVLACFGLVCLQTACGEAPAPPSGGVPAAPEVIPGPPAASPQWTADGGTALSPSRPIVDGRESMAARLESIVSRLDPLINPFFNTARVAVLKEAISKSTIPRQQIMLRSNLADELLKAGRIDEAIEVVELFLWPGASAAIGAPPLSITRDFLALCYMRLGTQENCVARHNAKSCLLPIGKEGIYARQKAPRAAARELTTLLEENPDDLRSRWLLNIISMTIGEYPAKVPERWRIPTGVFEAEYDIGRFDNVAPAVGIALPGQAGGGLMEDFDGDGLLDIMVSSMGLRDQMRLYHNEGTGRFIDRTEAAGLLGETGGLNMVHADYDNDGDQDVLVLRGGWMKRGGRFPNSLLRNDGTGRFEDVTESAGLLQFHPTQTAAWGDYDNDGWLDLIIGNESTDDDPHPCALYHNNRDGTFTDMAASLGEPILAYVKGVVWGDYDNDGLQDLYMSVQNGDNILFHNDGPAKPGTTGAEGWLFSRAGERAGVTRPRFSLPAWFWDYDNDGWLDLFVGGYQITDMADIAALHLGRESRTATPRLFRNRGDGTFADVTSEARLDRVALVMGSNFGDLDNDGYPDLYLGTGAPDLRAVIPNRLLRNDGKGKFQDVTYSAGVGHLAKGHGVAFGDIDNDGDQDLFEEMGGFYEIDIFPSALFENPGHGNRWVTLRLEGRRSNRSGIGARIRVRVRTPDGLRVIHALVGTGGSFGGSSIQQEIGLGNALSIETVEIYWPATGETQVLRDLDLDRFYRVVEGESAVPEEVKTFRLANSS